MNYYNEFDAKTAAWLRELVKAKLIPVGDVDERSIIEVKGHELTKYTQCHFFAGIGGWSEALRIAGWPSDEPVWTGSCPCQPFSAAGAQKGEADSRHLWPELFRLIKQCRPSFYFGEQSPRAINAGWLDRVSTDLEGEDYAIAPAVLGAHSVKAFHIRQRLYVGAVRTNAARIRREWSWSNAGTWSKNEFSRLVRASVSYAVPAGKRGLLCDGLPRAVASVALKGFGNAIVPQVGAAFITAFMRAQETPQ